MNFNQVSPGSCETRRGNSTLMWGVKRQIHWASPFTGDLTKFGRGDASSPAPATTLAQPQQNQTQTHHTTQQTFLNPALPPGYSYTSLPYYTGVPGLPSTFQYGPAVFPVSAWTWSLLVVKNPRHYPSYNDFLITNKEEQFPLLAWERDWGWIGGIGIRDSLLLELAKGAMYRFASLRLSFTPWAILLSKLDSLHQDG